MLPPPPPIALLEANPHFANLYNHLTTNVLSEEGSTASKSKEHELTRRKLNEARESLLQEDIVLKALEEISTPVQADDKPSQIPRASTTSAKTGFNDQPVSNVKVASLPPDLRELVFNVANYLSISLNPATSHTLPPDADELMADELATFQARIPEISEVLSQHLINIESRLSSTASTLFPQTPSKTDQSLTNTTSSGVTSSRSVANLNQHKPTSLTSALPSSSLQPSLHPLPTSLTNLQATLQAHQQTHAQTLTQRIRTLELATHGAEARHLTSRSSYLASVARGIELKAQIARLEQERTVYGDVELMERLEDESEALAREERALDKHEGELTALLGEYEEAGREAVGRVVAGGRVQREGERSGSGEDVFRVLGERYAEIEMEIGQVKRDIERLETRVWRGR